MKVNGHPLKLSEIRPSILPPGPSNFHPFHPLWPWIISFEKSSLSPKSKNEERAAACQATRRAFWIIGGVGTAIFVFGTIGIYICKLGLPAKCVYICKTYGQSDPSLINGSFLILCEA